MSCVRLMEWKRAWGNTRGYIITRKGRKESEEAENNEWLRAVVIIIVMVLVVVCSCKRYSVTKVTRSKWKKKPDVKQTAFNLCSVTKFALVVNNRTCLNINIYKYITECVSVYWILWYWSGKWITYSLVSYFNRSVYSSASLSTLLIC